jgi:predicted metallo-beta-lactamase superfamily hydrolase
MLDRGCVDWMLAQEPDVAIAAGPPFFDPSRVGEEEERIATSLLRRLSAGVPRVVIDHQALRSDDWRRFFRNGGSNVICAAQAEGQEPLPLESMRERLYEREGVEEGFREKLDRGEVPDRLHPVLLEEGLEGYFEEKLG